MSQSNKSFTIQSREVSDDLINAAVTLDPEHDLFKGHFPDNPVMPGVLNIEILKAILEEHTDHRILEVSSMKFLKPVRPARGISLNYAIQVKNNDDHVRILATGTMNEGIFVKVQLKLIPFTT